MASTTRIQRRPLLVRLTPQLVLLLVVAAGASAWTVVRADGMWEMPGTGGLGFASFAGTWTLMMAAMMLPSVSPFASLYARTVTEQRTRRLTLFAVGYLVVWVAAAPPVYALARLAGEYAGGDGGTALAVVIFAACGVYQLTPLKRRCLAHCRTPLGHMLHYASLRGPLRDLRAGLDHGWYCLACCWALMALIVAFGVMNVPAMVALASLVAVEKLWPRGELFSRVIGAGAIVAAAAVIWLPGLAPGLTGSADTTDSAASQDSMSMER